MAIVGRRGSRPLLSSRKPLSAVQFGQAYFSGEAVAVATSIRAVLSTYLDVDVRYLHPDNDLIRDLRLDLANGRAAADILWHLKKACGIDLPQQIVRRLSTLRDLIEYTCEHRMTRD